MSTNTSKQELKRLKRAINEATSSGAASGRYTLPMSTGLRLFDKETLEPFTINVSEFNDAMLSYDSYDGSLDVSLDKAKKMESNAKKISNWIKNHPNQSDDDGDIINQTPKSINEDLAVWFGTKKKPKGSKQPKGPWVNICKKIDGKHPPCGRPTATDKAYPKCRAAGVAGKMTDSQKKSACQQKRRAEKTHSKVGTGNKPKMVSYKPRKQNESFKKELLRLVLESINR